MIRRLSLLLFLVAGIIGSAAKAPTDGMHKVARIATPDTEFFGSVTFRSDATGRWVCVFDSLYAVEVIPWGHKAAPDYWQPTTEYRLYKTEPDGTCTLLDKSVVTDNNSRTALRIEQSYNSGPRLTVAGGVDVFTDCIETLRPIPMSSHIAVYSEKRNAKMTVDSHFDTYPYRETVTYTLPETTENSHTGRWSYLDRDTPRDRHAVLGGQYVFDIVDDPDSPGDMIIVYVDGAKIDRQFWKPGDIKGRLSKTDFPDHYNLTWYDSRRREMHDGECSATFEGTNLLTLDFPLLRSRIRLSR